MLASLVMNDTNVPQEPDKPENDVVFLRLSPEMADRAKAESQRLSISLNAFMKMLLNQYFDGIVFQRKEVK